MGRQVHISVLPEDAEALLAHIKSRHRVALVQRDDFHSATVTPLDPLSKSANETFILWNQELLPHLQRKRISRGAAVDYYRVDVSAEPVLEFRNSFLGDWHDKASITQGLIYGIFDNKSQEFLRWHTQIFQYIHRAFVRNPVLSRGYVGPAAYKWFLKGGSLSPSFIPPEVDVWRGFFADQDLIRARLKAASDSKRTFPYRESGSPYPCYR